jgi:hypothetical protein
MQCMYTCMLCFSGYTIARFWGRQFVHRFSSRVFCIRHFAITPIPQSPGYHAPTRLKSPKKTKRKYKRFSLTFSLTKKRNRSWSHRQQTFTASKVCLWQVSWCLSWRTPTLTFQCLHRPLRATRCYHRSEKKGTFLCHNHKRERLAKEGAEQMNG